MLDPCTVTGTVEQPTGAIANGDVIFTPERFVDIEDEVIVAAVPIAVGLDPVTGAFAVTLWFSYRVAGDTYSDTYSDTYPGSVISPPAHYAVAEPFGDNYEIEIDATLGGAALLTDLHP